MRRSSSRQWDCLHGTPPSRTWKRRRRWSIHALPSPPEGNGKDGTPRYTCKCDTCNAKAQRDGLKSSKGVFYGLNSSDQITADCIAAIVSLLEHCGIYAGRVPKPATIPGNPTMMAMPCSPSVNRDGTWNSVVSTALLADMLVSTANAG